MSEWQLIHYTELADALEKGWRWRKRKKGAPRLQLIAPSGAVWDFTLHGGMYIRPAAGGGR